MRDMQEVAPAGYCCRCRGEIYDNDVCFVIDDLVYCEDCIDAFRCEGWELSNER